VHKSVVSKVDAEKRAERTLLLSRKSYSLPIDAPVLGSNAAGLEEKMY
jgi:hypothetical protein